MAAGLQTDYPLNPDLVAYWYNSGYNHGLKEAPSFGSDFLHPEYLEALLAGARDRLGDEYAEFEEYGGSL